MARTPLASPRRNGWTLIPPTVTLALWRLGSTWRLLLNAGLGMLVAVALVCAVPLFSQVATSAGLRAALRADPAGTGISARVQLQQPLTAALVSQIHATLDAVVQRDMGAYLAGPPQFSLQTPNISLLAGKNGTQTTTNSLQLLGYAPADLGAHVVLSSGRLPATQSSTLEILLASAEARTLNARVGSSVILTTDAGNGKPLVAHLVGIFAPRDSNDAFWNGHSFEPEAINGNGSMVLTGIAANNTLLALLAQVQSPSGQGSGAGLAWNYPLDVSRLAADNLGTLIERYNALRIESQNALTNGPNVALVDIESGLNALSQYQLRIGVLQVPITLLLLQVLALVIFFVSLMADIVVDRQADAIAVLRSRGASRRQIFGALATQSVGLGLIALILGPLLAIVAVRLVAQHALAASDQNALNVIGGSPLTVALSISWYILIAVLGAIGAMVIAINRAMGQDVLAFRREAARATRRPLWQRLNLDIVMAVIGVTGYVSYVLGVQRLDPQVQAALSPLSLIAPIFLLIAATLLFLRVFPVLLQAGAWLTARGRGAAPMLALAQMSRSPRQTLRMTLLLALATAFTIFTLVFVASQAQHTIDTATYSVGADFTGNLPSGKADGVNAVNTLTVQYQAIPGVTSATIGYQTSVSGNTTASGLNIDLRAVDADTFAHTGIWNAADSPQSLAALMQQLAAGRATAAQNDTVPAVVDEATWEGFHLDQNPHFTLGVPGYTGGALHLIAIARVPHIPTIYDAPNYNFEGGVLVDYQSYAAVYQADITTLAFPNAVWLRTQSDAASLASVRAAITGSTSALRLEGVQDRWAIIAAAQTDPLQIDLLGVLFMGVVAASFLGLVGTLVASWLSARNRQTNFAVLRALGGDPRQIATVLLWEQGIIFTTALLLGVGLGAVLASVVLPTLIFTSLITSQNAFLLTLNVPPIQTVVPFGWLGVLLGGLILVFVSALTLMTRVVTRPSVSQTLRLNED